MSKRYPVIKNPATAIDPASTVSEAIIDKLMNRRKFTSHEEKDKIDMKPLPLNSLTLMNYIIHFVNNVICRDTELTPKYFNYKTDLITNVALYYFQHFNEIISHYNEKGNNKPIIIVDGKNIAHNYGFLKNNFELFKSQFKYGSGLINIYKNIIETKDFDNKYMYKDILQILLPAINSDFYYIFVINRDVDLDDEQYNPLTIFSDNLIRCNVNCTSNIGKKCHINYHNDESDDYLCVLLYNTLLHSEYNDNLYGILTGDNYDWYKNKQLAFIETRQLYKVIPKGLK